MKVPFVQVCSALSQFVGVEILPKAFAGSAFMQGAVGFLVSSKMPQLLESYISNPTLKSIGVICENNEVDVDLLYQVAQAGFQKEPEVAIDLPDPLGRGHHVFKATQQDVDMIYQYLTGGKKQ